MALVEAYLGEIRLFAGDFAPGGWALCRGQLVRIEENTPLFSILGTMYGGDGRTTFALPDLRDRIPVHTGQGASVGMRRAGAGVAAGNDERLPSMLAMNYMICVQGIYPDRG
ncbi:MAG: tail fiber protein [Caldilineaceae bacterium]